MKNYVCQSVCNVTSVGDGTYYFYTKENSNLDILLVVTN